MIRSQPGWARTGRGGAALFRPGLAPLPGVPWASEQERRPRHPLSNTLCPCALGRDGKGYTESNSETSWGAAVHCTATLKDMCLSQIQWWSRGQACCGGLRGHGPGCIVDMMEAGACSRVPLTLMEPAIVILRDSAGVRLRVHWLHGNATSRVELLLMTHTSSESRGPRVRPKAHIPGPQALGLELSWVGGWEGGWEGWVAEGSSRGLGDPSSLFSWLCSRLRGATGLRGTSQICGA